MSNLDVNELFQSVGTELRLSWKAGKKGGKRSITVSGVNRPGLSLAGYYDFFRPERVQIMGLGEYGYLQRLDNANRLSVVAEVFKFKNLPCVILTHGKKATPEILEAANQNNVPVFETELQTSQLTRELAVYLENRLAPMTVVHGVLTVVYGLGVLIVGGSGSGKSECGLELVHRGHMLVADDYVEVRHHPGDILMGSAGPNVKHLMEVRGLGLIDVNQVFGVGAVKESNRIELVVRIEVGEKKETHYDRIGLEDNTTEILGVRLPEILLPLRPGRNVAVLLEVAALNHRLKQRGIFPAKEFNEKLIETMKKSRKKKVRTS